MHKAPAESSDPQTALAIAEHSTGLELSDTSWERMRHLCFPIDETSDSTAHSDQECAVIAFSQALDAVRLARQRMEFWRTRFPSPQPVLHSHPEIALGVVVQAECSAAKNSILSVAMDAAILNRAEL